MNAVKRMNKSYLRTLAATLVMPIRNSHYKRVQIAIKIILIRAYANNLIIYSVTHKGETSVCIGNKFYEETPERRRSFNRALAELVNDSLIRLKADNGSSVAGFELTAKGNTEAICLIRAFRLSVQLQRIYSPQIKPSGSA